ncbi:MAG TPA: alpha/beta fold hydrolase, partial [Gammaproteobacteria bacterium]
MAVELYYREEGSGAPLLVLHGLFGSSSNWARLARGLAAEFRVICADLRNHGRSPHAAGMSYPQMAADVVALLDRLRLDRVALLGHSMGGKVAMQVALNQPERVSRLLVADIAPRAYRGNQAIVLEALEALHLDSLASRREADERLAAQVPETGVRAFLLTNLTQEQGRFGWRINLPEIIDGIEAIE